MRLSLLAGLLFAVAGCGGNSNPKFFLITLDGQPLLAGSIPSECSTATPSTTTSSSTTESNLREAFQWVQWEGPDGKSYLDIGKSADVINSIAAGRGVHGLAFSSTIESKDGKTYSGSLTSQTQTTGTGASSATVTAAIVVTFTDNGAAPKGTIKFSVSRDCTGAGCDAADKFTCSPGDVSFAGRRVDTQNFTVVGTSPTNP